MKKRESWEYKTLARLDRQRAQEQEASSKRLEELRLMEWVELKYWLSKQLAKGVEAPELMKQLGLTIQGYDLLLSDDSRALHPMTVSSAGARVRAYEGRFEESYGEFAKALIARKKGW